MAHMVAGSIGKMALKQGLKLGAKNAASSVASSAAGGGGLKAAAGNFLKTPTADGMTRGQKGFNWLMPVGVFLVGLVIIGAGYWLMFVKNKKYTRKQRSEVPPSPMSNARVSRVQPNYERMFTNNPGQNKYRRQLSVGGDEYGGYYGHNPAGFSQSEENYVHPMNNHSTVQKPQFYLKNPGNNNLNVLSEMTMSTDPELDEEVYDDMMNNLMAKDDRIKARRKARMSKSIQNGNYNVGHINQVSEINTASSLSASNNFQGPFGTNGGERLMQSYIQPIEKRGVNADALNFASITK